MSNPNFDTYVSVMHALFALENQYGLHAYRDKFQRISAHV